MAEILSIADAVVTALNADEFQETLTEEFTAERLFLPNFKLEDMDALHVSVVPKSMTEEAASRNDVDYQYQIDIGVQKRFTKLESSEIDPLVDLVEQIAALFKLASLPTYTDVTWIKTDHPALYAPEHMEQLRQFTSVLTLTYRRIK